MPRPGRLVNALLLCVLAFGGFPARAEDAAPGIAVTFLGTNGPMPEPGRVGTSTLIEAGGQTLLFDAGLNVTQQLVEAGISPAAVRDVFLTHFHSDHIAGLPGLWSTGWLRRRDEALRLYGPTGTAQIGDGVLAVFALDIPIRLNGPERLPPGGEQIESTELGGEGVLFDRSGVRVTAFPVDHGEDVGLAFGYRIDYAGMAVVLSGDTTYSENVVAQGQDADLLVHEVMGVTQELLDAGRYRSGVLEVHATPEQAGQVFAETQPRLAAYTHIIYARQPGFAAMTEAELVARTRTRFDGPLLVPGALDRVVVTAQEIRLPDGTVLAR